MKIRTRFRLNLVISIVTPLIVVLLLFTLNQEFAAGRQQRRQASEIRVSISQLSMLLSELIVRPGERVVLQWQAMQGKLNDQLAGVSFDDPDQLAACNSLLTLNQVLGERFSIVTVRLNALSSRETSFVSGRDELAERMLLQLLNTLQHMRDESVLISELTEKHTIASLHRHGETTLVSVTVLALLMALVSISTARRVSPALRRLQEGVHIIQEGDLDFRLGPEPEDEIGDLAKALNAMLDIRVAAIQALEASEGKYRSLIDNLPLNIFLKDPDLHYLSCNRAYAESLGIDKEDIFGKTDFDFFSKDLAEKYRVDDQAVLSEGKPIDIEEKFLVAGHESWVQTIKVPLFDQNNQSAGLLGIFWGITERKRVEETILKLNRDLEQRVHERTGDLQRTVQFLEKEIVERKRVEQALRESEDRLSRAVLDAPFPIMIHAEDGEVILISHSWTELTGYLPEDIPTIADWVEKAYGEKMALVGDVIDELYGLTEKTHEGEFELITKNGQHRIWDFSSAPLGRTADGRRMVISMAVDVTERREWEIALKKSEERYRSYFQLGQIGMAITSPAKRWVEVNDRLCDILGYTDEELKTMTWEQLTHPADLKRNIALFSRLLDGSEDEYALEKRFIHKDGKVIHTFIAVSCVRRPDGEPDYFVALLQDISQTKRVEESLAKTVVDLKRSNQELEQFAYVASHDLQEPLRMVASYVQLLARRYRGKLDADADDFINYAVTGANRMQELINDLLAFSRAGRNKDALVPVSCEEVLKTTLDNLERAISETRAVITHDPLPRVNGKFLQLTQVFQNLVANAIKFQGEETPRIHIGARQEGSQWLFSVKDNGIGIDPEYFKKVFVIFQRLHGKDEYPGTGIGLALSKKIVESHGGRIWIESQSKKGSTFFFTLNGVVSHENQ